MFEKFLNLFRSKPNEIKCSIFLKENSYEIFSDLADERAIKNEEMIILFWRLGFFFELVKHDYEMSITYKNSDGSEKTISYEELIKFLLKEDE